jgi:hypothetical protein
MTVIVSSPYLDDQTRTDDICILIENWIKDNWDETATGILKTDIKFGYAGDQILQSGKNIVLRAYVFFSTRDRMNVGGSRWQFTDSIYIDIYVLNNNLATGRDPRAIKMMKFIEGLCLTHQGDSTKGIYEIKLKNSVMDQDPFKNNLTHAKIGVVVTYIADVVNA